MNTYRSSALDHCWLIFVLLHIVGSMFLVIIMGFTLGMIALNSILWLYCAYANRREKMGILLSAIGWSATYFLMNHMSSGYLVSFTMNMILFCYLLYQHYGSFPLLFADSHIKKVRLKDLIYILILLLMIIVLGTFLNAVSTLFVSNHVSASLSMVDHNLWTAIIALALAPALVEELFFRAYIFNRLGNGKKAILMSALLFSLGHMNFNQMCYAFVIGLFFAMIYAATDNLLISMSIHALFNLYSVLMAYYEDSVWVKEVRSLSIAGYSIFNPQILNVEGHIIWTTVAVGLVLFLLMLLLICLTLRFIANEQKETSYEGKEVEWKPGFLFYLACLLCLIVAILLQ